MDLHVIKDVAIAQDNGIVDPYDQDSITNSFIHARLPEECVSYARWLMSTEESIDVPASAVGLIQVRSTWARLGLLSPPTIADPGFVGNITLEIFNASPHSILIRDGDALFSIHYLSSQDPLYRGRYQGQSGLQLPKALKHG